MPVEAWKREGATKMSASTLLTGPMLWKMLAIWETLEPPWLCRLLDLLSSIMALVCLSWKDKEHDVNKHFNGNRVGVKTNREHNHTVCVPSTHWFTEHTDDTRNYNKVLDNGHAKIKTAIIRTLFFDHK